MGFNKRFDTLLVKGAGVRGDEEHLTDARAANKSVMMGQVD